VVVGVADDDLNPIVIDPSGPFVIAGPPGSGRTTALETIARGIGARSAPPKLYLLSPRRSSLTRSKIWTEAADSSAQVPPLIAQLLKDVEDGLQPGSIALFLENLADFGGSGSEYELERLVKALLKDGHFVVGEAETQYIPRPDPTRESASWTGVLRCTRARSPDAGSYLGRRLMTDMGTGPHSDGVQSLDTFISSRDRLRGHHPPARHT
jgi:hypothetical protein